MQETWQTLNKQKNVFVTINILSDPTHPDDVLQAGGEQPLVRVGGVLAPDQADKQREQDSQPEPECRVPDVGQLVDGEVARQLVIIPRVTCGHRAAGVSQDGPVGGTVGDGAGEGRLGGGDMTQLGSVDLGAPRHPGAQRHPIEEPGHGPGVAHPGDQHAQGEHREDGAIGDPTHHHGQLQHPGHEPDEESDAVPDTAKHQGEHLGQKSLKLPDLVFPLVDLGKLQCSFG